MEAHEIHFRLTEEPRYFIAGQVDVPLFFHQNLKAQA
jgi:hypothetical protein